MRISVQGERYYRKREIAVGSQGRGHPLKKPLALAPHGSTSGVAPCQRVCGVYSLQRVWSSRANCPRSAPVSRGLAELYHIQRIQFVHSEVFTYAQTPLAELCCHTVTLVQLNALSCMVRPRTHV